MFSRQKHVVVPVIACSAPGRWSAGSRATPRAPSHASGTIRSAANRFSSCVPPSARKSSDGPFSGERVTKFTTLADRIRTVHRRLRSARHIDLGNEVRRNLREIEQPAVIEAVDRNAVQHSPDCSSNDPPRTNRSATDPRAPFCAKTRPGSSRIRSKGWASLRSRISALVMTLDTRTLLVRGDIDSRSLHAHRIRLRRQLQDDVRNAGRHGHQSGIRAQLPAAGSFHKGAKR